MLSEPWKIYFHAEGIWGSTPRKFLAPGVANCEFLYHSRSFCSNTPTPYPFKKSPQIYTDLKNAPGRWKRSENALAVELDLICIMTQYIQDKMATF